MLEQIGIKGIGSEGVIAIVIYLLIKFELLPRLKRKRYDRPENDRRKEKKPNPNDKPGNSATCKENRDKIIALETQAKLLKEENREDHKEIKDKIKRLFTLWNSTKT